MTLNFQLISANCVNHFDSFAWCFFYSTTFVESNSKFYEITLCDIKARNSYVAYLPQPFVLHEAKDAPIMIRKVKIQIWIAVPLFFTSIEFSFGPKLS